MKADRTISHTMSRRRFNVAGWSALAALGLSRVSFGQTVIHTNVPVEVEQANVAVVNEFCAAFARRDLAKASSLLAENCTYRVNQTRPPIVGRDKVVNAIKGFIGRTIEFKVRRTTAFGPMVINERDDIFAMPSASERRSYRVAAGVFYLDKGHIVEWTDYVVA